MAGLKKGSTLFDVVPALGAISAHGAGTAKLMPEGFEHPGFELSEGVNRLGRDPAQNHHVILSSHVSRTHCEVLLSAGKIWARDLGSHNGTFVNGERITEHELQPGDKLGLSKRVVFMLVMDAEMVRPIGMELDMGAASASAAAAAPALPPAPAAQGPTGPVAATPGAPVPEQISVSPSDEEPDQATRLKQMEQQRNVLAILYQVSLRCLLVDNLREVERLMTNVLGRLAPMDAGFVLYQLGSSWRASICPNTRERPNDATVRAAFHLASQRKVACVINDPRELSALGVGNGSSVLLVPLVLGDTVTGVIGAISGRAEVYGHEILDIVMQLANVAAAALRERGTGRD
jgi:hypothetical protein